MKEWFSKIFYIHTMKYVALNNHVVKKSIYCVGKNNHIILTERCDLQTISSRSICRDREDIQQNVKYFSFYVFFCIFQLFSLTAFLCDWHNPIIATEKKDSLIFKGLFLSEFNDLVKLRGCVSHDILWVLGSVHSMERLTAVLGLHYLGIVSVKWIGMYYIPKQD